MILIGWLLKWLQSFTSCGQKLYFRAYGTGQRKYYSSSSMFINSIVQGSLLKWWRLTNIYIYMPKAGHVMWLFRCFYCFNGSQIQFGIHSHLWSSNQNERTENARKMIFAFFSTLWYCSYTITHCRQAIL